MVSRSSSALVRKLPAALAAHSLPAEDHGLPAADLLLASAVPCIPHAPVQEVVLQQGRLDCRPRVQDVQPDAPAHRRVVQASATFQSSKKGP